MLLSPVCEVAGERRRFLFYLIEDETLFQPLGFASVHKSLYSSPYSCSVALFDSFNISVTYFPPLKVKAHLL